MSRKPSGRLEVVQLMRMMDDMLEKAGVDQQSEELTELSQLVHVEQNIYNIVFHEVIRQVSVGCAERGQLLAKLRLAARNLFLSSSCVCVSRQRYQSLLDRIPRHLKALHTEAVAQRALDRRLTEEICLIKTSIQQLSMYVGQGQAAGAKEPNVTKCSLSSGVCAHLSVVQGYHELYELQRARLEAQLVQMTEERDCWKQLTFCVAFKDTDNLNIILELSDHWKEQLSAFMSQLKETENAQYEQTSAIQQGIVLSCCPKIPISVSLQMLALQCERYQGEKVLGFQQTLSELGHVQERWLNMSLQMFSRHPSPDGEPSKVWTFYKILGPSRTVKLDIYGSWCEHHRALCDKRQNENVPPPKETCFKHVSARLTLLLLKMNSVIAVLQGELRDYEEAVVNMIDYDRSIIQRKLGEISVHLKGVRKLNHTLFISLLYLSFCMELNIQVVCL
uniref:Uncharacterized protein n=1 Tax=Monopterus albus TaxID=43700 RepID=A0A3Q3R2I5_MONAL